jgi:cytochrome c
MRLLSLAIYLAFAMTTASAQDAPALKRGEPLLAENCSRCHATARTDEGRYPVEFLEEALGEGIISGHPDSPEFQFAADDVGDIIAYLKSIQERCR